MAFFADLSPYSYDHTEPNPKVLNIGWLGEGQPFSQGPVARPFFRVLLRLTESPVNLYRGTHECEFCELPHNSIQHLWRYRDRRARVREGNGEIRVPGLNGIIYVAPVLIVHYIAEHQYQPPQEFIDAVLQLDKAQ